MLHPDPWYIWEGTAEEFLLGMLTLGRPLELSLVGVFDAEGRGSRRDIDLPMHRDGAYSEELAKKQGGLYVEKANIHIVGLYCLRAGAAPCLTLIDAAEIDLQKGQAVIFDNRRVLHGRRGPVGTRLLMRMWLQTADVT